MRYIIWDNGEVYNFADRDIAIAYIAEVQKDDPLVAFSNFGMTASNRNNRVAVLRDYDTVQPWQNAPDYLRPKVQA